MEEFHESSVVLPLGKYYSTSTIASSRLRLAAVRGAVYPQLGGLFAPRRGYIPSYSSNPFHKVAVGPRHDPGTDHPRDRSDHPKTEKTSGYLRAVSLQVGHIPNGPVGYTRRKPRKTQPIAAPKNRRASGGTTAHAVHLTYGQIVGDCSAIRRSRSQGGAPKYSMQF